MSTPDTIKAPMPSEATMRRALAARDAHYDGRFVYGVVTTGVYCRPSCASRPAKPQNVRFFATPEAAESAGLRPCKRCRPRDPQHAMARRMQLLARYIEAHADQTLPLARLANQAHLSPAHLQRTFKAALGVSPKAYQDAARLGRLKSGLKAGRSVLDSIADAGFQSTSRLYGTATRSLGMTPSAYRAGGAGETIAYACRDTVLGPLLMAGTDRGVCFAQFGPSETALTAQLREEFPKATLVESRMATSRELDAWIKAFEAHVAGSVPRPDLPLDLRGTAFQIKVWRFLLQVPEGEVLSYSELAAGIEAPKAVRAAASACAANRIAVLVPCHRVLRGDGGLGGYRWGLERKRALLDQERARRSS
ncbi:MAG TPA: bifunctional DNA-binding transcriptional regulator/O6-methylguanine-DNA methyltransferase Ada [Steroidobacteraceae bacterium]|nr:bifunctional DNA-binding transcriptional regulator/O6-methylguanine-DNA methyltransferase Ada [Steroidobacteraceae bacterium]